MPRNAGVIQGVKPVILLLLLLPDDLGALERNKLLNLLFRRQMLREFSMGIALPLKQRHCPRLADGGCQSFMGPCLPFVGIDLHDKPCGELFDVVVLADQRNFIRDMLRPVIAA